MTRFPCSSRFTGFLKDLPKCEHHLHIEGTLEPALLFALAARNNIELPEWFPQTVEACNKRYSEFADLQDFLNHYYVGMGVLIHEEDFYDLAMAYFEHAHRDGCLHSEVFFDPQGHVERGISVDKVVNGLHRACKDAAAKFGTTQMLIMCLLRHLPSSSGMETLASAEKYYESGVISGLGLDSAEKPFPPELFEECYTSLKEKFPEVRLTAHAGEEGDHTYVTKALDVLKVSRVDHGVNSKQSEALMDRLVKNDTLLTMCPLSNVKLQVVKDVDELPYREFFDKGISFSINSDDPAYFGGYILDNYVAVQTRFGFSVKEWCTIVLNGINGSWCGEKRKQELREILDDVYGKYKDVL
ncbi:adenosine deaminase [Candidozyma duobushaemuli]|uniref:Adenine deaminase n=2 Tax=Candidozyma TaxID=3303203 RepID=A0ABX8IA31_9ASCO|nr:adenosine deaminase [[Candida] duobushaemulonis]PVH15975.1 adenosine deaminase [[Candida] duobushaemulonis]QWU89334.1 hypothetical protein CA3LBN_003657 [[Candida] haemuloni]